MEDLLYYNLHHYCCHYELYFFKILFKTFNLSQKTN